MSIQQQCQIIAVLGGKGGVGKSVVAANLSLAIMTESKAQVLLIDADQKSAGDQNVLLGLKPLKTLSELTQYQNSLSSQNLPQMVTPHKSGLFFVGAVRGPDEFLNVQADSFNKVLEFFSAQFKYIIIDLGNDLGPLQLRLLQESTVGLIVTTPEILVLNQTQRLIQDLLKKTFPLQMFYLVINRYANGVIAPEIISNNLKLQNIGIIPQDEATVNQSIQRGTPFMGQQGGGGGGALPASYYEISRKLNGGILQKLKALNRPTVDFKILSEDGGSGAVGTSGSSISGVKNTHSNLEEQDPRNILKMRIHNELIKVMDLKKGVADTQGDPEKERQLRDKTMSSVTQIVDRQAAGVSRDERSKLIKEVLEEALGLGPLEDLLADPSVTEIMVNGYKRIFVERSGKILLSPITFTSNLHLRNVIERIVTPLGRRIDEKTPMVDARLKDGSRVNAIIEPLSIDGPALTIRKFKKGGISAEQYMNYGSINRQMIDFLRICVENGLNIVISGGTGSGKTSLLNMLSSFIPANERIVTVEDAAELQLQQEHVVRLETRPSNMEGSGTVTIRDLIKNALRMRPDRIIVGETRDGAALDMLQAMNTGHDGSMTTTHANSPRECIARLETLTMMSGMELPVKAIREQIASAVNLIVQISRLSDGSRRVMSVTEVVGMQGDVVSLQEIFKFKEVGYDKNRRILGQFQSLGLIPSFIEKFEQKGVIVPRDIFSNDHVQASNSNVNANIKVNASNLGSNSQSKPTTSDGTKKGLSPLPKVKLTGS